MSRQELDLAVDWAAAEGWNPGLHDANCFYAIDPTGKDSQVIRSFSDIMPDRSYQGRY